MLPKTPYFELLDHPENKIVYLFKDEINKIKSKLQLTSTKLKRLLNGIIVQANKLNANENTEDPIKTW